MSFNEFFNIGSEIKRTAYQNYVIVFRLFQGFVISLFRIRLRADFFAVLLYLLASDFASSVLGFEASVV